MRLDERPENFSITPATEGSISDDNGSESEEFSQEGDFNFDEPSPTVEHSLGMLKQICNRMPTAYRPPPPPK